MTRTVEYVKTLPTNEVGAVWKLYRIVDGGPLRWTERHFDGEVVVDRTRHSTRFVIASAATLPLGMGDEVLIFPGSKHGEITGWCEIGGARGHLDHDRAMRESGFDIR